MCVCVCVCVCVRKVFTVSESKESNVVSEHQVKHWLCREEKEEEGWRRRERRRRGGRGTKVEVERKVGKGGNDSKEGMILS